MTDGSKSYFWVEEEACGILRIVGYCCSAALCAAVASHSDALQQVIICGTPVFVSRLAVAGSDALQCNIHDISPAFLRRSSGSPVVSIPRGHGKTDN